MTEATPETEENILRLADYLGEIREPVFIAFSGGVDSTLLVRVAHMAGLDFYPVTVVHQATPRDDMAAVKDMVDHTGLSLIIIDADIHQIPGFTDNPPHRCYLCKKEMITQIRRRAEAMSPGGFTIIDGTNLSDMGTGRPGIRALKESGVRSPLAELGFTKENIRDMARYLDLPWDRPSQPCFGTRIPAGERITEEKIRMVSRAEAFLKSKGILQCRVRYIGGDAKVELGEDYMSKARETEGEIKEMLEKVGFGRVWLSEEPLKRG